MIPLNPYYWRDETGSVSECRSGNPSSFAKKQGFLLSLFMVFIMVSCVPPEIIPFETEDFELSQRDSEAFYEEFIRLNPVPASISGRATAQMSEPGNTERFMLRFQSDHSHSLLTLTNTLNIEAGRIYSDTDSVIVYNRIEKEAHKMSHADAAFFYLNGMSTFNLIEMMHPLRDKEEIRRIFENKQYYRVETKDGRYLYIERESMRLKRTEQIAASPDGYQIFEFEQYIRMEGYVLPRHIRLLSSSEKSIIFLVIRALDLNPKLDEPDPGIPDNISLIRI